MSDSVFSRYQGQDLVDHLHERHYSTLVRVGGWLLSKNRDVSLSARSLVHLAYLKAHPRRKPLSDLLHFINSFRRTMKHLISNHRRAKDTLKRGKKFQIVSLSSIPPELAVSSNDKQKLEMAIEAIAKDYPLRAQVLKYTLQGYTQREIARMIGVSVKTVWQRLRSGKDLLRYWLRDNDA